MMTTKFEDMVLDQAAAFGIFRKSLKAFPKLDPEKALAKYAQENKITGVFFVDEFGDRCIYGGRDRVVKPYKHSISITIKEVEVTGSRIYTHATRSLVSTGRSGKNCGNYAMYLPTADLPTGEDWLGQVNEGICQIQHRRPPLMLQQWMYLDKLKTYNLFMQKLCTGLARLVIYVPDKNRLTPNLDQVCCGLDSLETVEVIQYNSNYSAGLSTEKWIPDADAAPIIQKILQQKKELRQSKLISYGAPIVSPPTEKKCDFCGETNHVWAECHNLCGVCWGFGHFRSSCSLLEENRATIKNLS
ncbi:hypothetical protein HYALB_00004919 [Hymenoscyphus albidus]|uniref:Uncharacterized protein n=1 Tax=Hymenoscyphus albidus TaxID=595503 RepID=A0A9N9LF81_9HELO|nr:hypothetical protein HYALB_00004919 [Hymenoscyphus albidus]